MGRPERLWHERTLLDGRLRVMVEVMTSGQAIAQAIAVAGSEDFGAGGFREGLERSLEAFRQVPLTPAAREAVNRKIVHDLAMRLRIEQYYQAHPEIADQPVVAPVFVVGMPRTGTTATVGMLALDDSFRFLRVWEGASPMPPPVAAEEHADPRAIAARATAANYAKPNVHISDPDGPEEDLAMLAGLDMHSYHGPYPMPDDYIDWWLADDFATTYAYQERVLKLLHSQRPPYRWLLKSPPHLFRLGTIARRYPDAKFVWTHRDPLKLIPSVASLHCILHEERCLAGSIDRKTLGPRHLAFWVEGLRRSLADRAAIGEDRFIDVTNSDVVKNPIAVFERIYEWLGMPLTPQLRNRLEDYNRRNAPGQFGKHHYTPEEYGLTDDEIRAAFKDYVERFGL